MRDGEFVADILDSYHDHGRSFPWRETDDPYCILLSEVMLQQTQTGRVLDKYGEFLSLWPDFRSLAEAPFDELLSHWRGLGYNRRALALQRTAKESERWDWTLPPNEDLLLSLPGVGPSTAAAIRAFSYHLPAIYLETNIRRVMIASFHKDEEDVPDAILREDLSRLLPLVEDVKEWYYALMDRGVELRTTEREANHRSRSYHKQSPFEGSNRQVRGLLIHLLSEEGERDRETILSQIPFSREQGLSALASLVRDSLVEEREERYRISHSSETTGK